MASSNLKTLKTIARVNLIVFVIIVIFEFISIFIDLPVMFVSEGDAAGIAEFSGGNWFDHILKMGVGIVFIYTFFIAVRSFSAGSNEERSKAQAFATGGSFLVIGIGFLFLLIWFSQFLDFAIRQSLGEWAWYAGFRFEIVLLFINLPIISIWKNRSEIFADLSV